MSTLENEEKNAWNPKIYHWELSLRKIMGMKNIRHCQQVYINGSGTYITVELMWCINTGELAFNSYCGWTNCMYYFYKLDSIIYIFIAYSTLYVSFWFESEWVAYTNIICWFYIYEWFFVIWFKLFYSKLCKIQNFIFIVGMSMVLPTVIRQDMSVIFFLKFEILYV